MALGVLAAKGQLVMPPSQPVQLFGGVVTIVMAPLLVILFACVHQSTPDAPRAFASPISAVGFAAWGPVLDGITALLAVWFRRRLR